MINNTPATVSRKENHMDTQAKIRVVHEHYLGRMLQDILNTYKIDEADFRGWIEEYKSSNLVFSFQKATKLASSCCTYEKISGGREGKKYNSKSCTTCRSLMYGRCNPVKRFEYYLRTRSSKKILPKEAPASCVSHISRERRVRFWTGREE